MIEVPYYVYKQACAQTKHTLKHTSYSVYVCFSYGGSFKLSSKKPIR